MRKSSVISRLKCTGCGHTFPIPRMNSKRRKRGHMKNLWCINCKKRTKHLEQEPTKYN